MGFLLVCLFLVPVLSIRPVTRFRLMFALIFKIRGRSRWWLLPSDVVVAAVTIETGNPPNAQVAKKKERPHQYNVTVIDLL